MRRGVVAGLMGLLVLLAVQGIVSAHANLLRAEPPPNTAIDIPPPEIRIWFTEPLEAQFSRINLRDSSGRIVETPPSQVDPTDPTQMFLVPGELERGVYTVVWRVLSTADGHPTTGFYPIAIGDASLLRATGSEVVDYIPFDSAFIRWANLFSLALGVGGVAFFLFVWRPTVPTGSSPIEARMRLLMGIGWAFIGVTSFLLILLQYALATGNVLFAGIDGNALNSLISGTRFGQLWLARMALWFGLGGALWFARGDSFFYGVALVIGTAILLTNSLFSHAQGAYDVTASVAADVLHLVGMVMWVGGLFYLLSIIGAVRAHLPDPAVLLGQVVARFSNFARIAVAALIITGVYSAWLQVGSVEGLLTTLYGQSLLIKLVLTLPVLGLAFVNLVYTHRGLQAGQPIWAGRLRKLVSMEIVLTLAILATVGAMTAGQPARNILSERAANPPAPPPQPIKDVQTANDLLIQFDAAPGWVGENTFTLNIVDTSGKPVEDITLIRMRFESQTQNLGETELRPTQTAPGIYSITGAALSVPGAWRIRLTIQRPDQFDTVLDFRPEVPSAPQPVLATPPPAPSSPLPNRVWVLLLNGLLALAVGGYFLGENRHHLRQLSALLAIGLMALGGVFLISAVQGAGIQTASANETGFIPTDDSPMQLAVNSNLPAPYLVTAGGEVLEPQDDATWSRLDAPTPVRDVYVDIQGVVWAATDAGFYAYEAGTWTAFSDQATPRVILTHGFYFALGTGQITRVSAGGVDGNDARILDLPQPDASAENFIMLGNHSHILLNGGSLYQTFDLGLSWRPLESPVQINTLSTDPELNMLAVTDEGIYVWHYTDGSLKSSLPLPGDDAQAVVRPFDTELYALGHGVLYRLNEETWEAIALPEAEDAVFTALAYQYPGTLWALDGAGSRLFATHDGQSWIMQSIQIN
jgi:copper transport protein